ncbi:MAG TPA: hypothetical protein VIK72_19120 [Clostridiaceae bacterium]
MEITNKKKNSIKTIRITEGKYRIKIADMEDKTVAYVEIKDEEQKK